jgi:hypothetical protein
MCGLCETGRKTERERKRKRDEIIEEKSAMSEGTKMEKDEHTNE